MQRQMQKQEQCKCENKCKSKSNENRGQIVKKQSTSDNGFETRMTQVQGM